MAAEEAADLEAEVAAATHPSSICTVCDWLEGREDAATWDRMMAAPTVRFGHVALANSMRRRGYLLKSSKPVENHRKQGHRGPA